MTSFEISLIIIFSSGVVIITCLLLFTLCSFSAEHERRRKQATIEHLSAIRGDVTNGLEQLQAILGRNKVKNDDMSDDDKKFVRVYLDTLEQLAVCVNMSLLDLELVTRYCRNHLLQAQEYSQSYIEHARFNFLQPTAYIEFEELCVRMKETQNEEEVIKQVRST